MKTNQLKGVALAVVCCFGIGKVSLAQLYSSGNNTITGNSVGIGTDDPNGKLEIENDVVPVASCGTCISLPQQDDPAIRIKTNLLTNPPSSTPTSIDYWDIRGKSQLTFEHGQGGSTNVLFGVGESESFLSGEKVTIADRFEMRTTTMGSGPAYSLGFGANFNSGTFSASSSSSAGAGIMSYQGSLRFYASAGGSGTSTSRLTIIGNKVGIGTDNPTSKLEVRNGDMKVKNGHCRVENGNVYLNEGDMKISDGRLVIADDQGVNQFEIKGDGSVVAREILVDINEAIPDYVFDDDYELLSLGELKEYLKKEHHLPNVPSAAEFEAQGGIELGEMTRILLEKQEELVLYILQLEERLSNVESTNNE